MSDRKLDISELVGDEVATAINRGGAFFDITRNSLVLVHSDCGPRVRLEHIPTKNNALSRVEWEVLAASVNRINEALDADLVSITPGISTLDMKAGRKAYEFLWPGHFDWEAVEKRPELPATRGIGPLASFEGQWVPPALTITFTAAEADAILVAIGVGLVGSLVAILKTAGVAGPVAGPLAIVLIAAGLLFSAAKLASKTGQVGIKFSTLPLPYCVPFPA